MDIVDWSRRVLYSRGHEYFGEPAPPREVAVERKSGVAVARIRFSQADYRVVIKPLARTANIKLAGELSAIHEHVRAISGPLADSLPRFVGFDTREQVVIVEFVPGPTLEMLLTTGPTQRASEALDATARILASLHEVDGSRVGLSGQAPRSNQSYVAHLQQLWTDRRIARVLPNGWTPRRLLDYLPSQFFSRTGRSVLLVDCQPKNVIVTERNRVVLVDIDYSRSNPAISVAAFLASLDRLAVGSLRHSARKTRWSKGVFLDSYRLYGLPEVIADAIFFYPWTLLQMFLAHVSARPRFRWYLERYYRARLVEFFAGLEGQNDPALALNTSAGSQSVL